MKSRKSKIIKIIKPYIKESLNDPWRVERLAKKIKKAAIKKTEQCDARPECDHGSITITVISKPTEPTNEIKVVCNKCSKVLPINL